MKQFIVGQITHEANESRSQDKRDASQDMPQHYKQDELIKASRASPLDEYKQSLMPDKAIPQLIPSQTGYGLDLFKQAGRRVQAMHNMETDVILDQIAVDITPTNIYIIERVYVLKPPFVNTDEGRPAQPVKRGLSHNL